MTLPKPKPQNLSPNMGQFAHCACDIAHLGHASRGELAFITKCATRVLVQKLLS
jgi:hypothetical protein